MASSIRRIGRTLLSTIIETVYPKTCAGCGMRGVWICEWCLPSGLRTSHAAACSRCGIPVLHGRCKCADMDASIHIGRSAFVYEGWPAEAVRAVKYHREPARAEHLADLMRPLITEFGAIDALIPVPLHPARERERGYNQSRLIASHLGGRAGIPVIEGIQRIRRTDSQTRLGGEQRRANVHGAFAIEAGWVPQTGRRLVLVDDVRTTSSTLNACARVLAPFSPAMIGVLTFAADLRHEDVEALRALQP